MFYILIVFLVFQTVITELQAVTILVAKEGKKMWQLNLQRKSRNREGNNLLLAGTVNMWKWRTSNHVVDGKTFYGFLWQPIFYVWRPFYNLRSLKETLKKVRLEHCIAMFTWII